MRIYRTQPASPSFQDTFSRSHRRDVPSRVYYLENLGLLFRRRK